MRRRTKRIVIAGLAAAVLGLGWWTWQQGAPKREALAAVRKLASALNDSASTERPLHFLALPPAIRERTTGEQAEFIRKSLQDEISEEGISVLQRDGQFGPLKRIFPQQAAAWATQAGVRIEDCVAFRLERNGQLAEVVLVRTSRDQGFPVFRIVRANNVKQLAAARF